MYFRWLNFLLLLVLSPSVWAGTFVPVGDVIGEVTTYRVTQEDNLYDIAQRFDIGIVELLAANPDIDREALEEGTELVITSSHLLPEPRKGIVLNLSELRLFYFAKDGSVMSFPLGIGKEGWQTPVGETSIVLKRRKPKATFAEIFEETDTSFDAVSPNITRITSGDKDSIQLVAKSLRDKYKFTLLNEVDRPGKPVTIQSWTADNGDTYYSIKVQHDPETTKKLWGGLTQSGIKQGKHQWLYDEVYAAKDIDPDAKTFTLAKSTPKPAAAPVPVPQPEKPAITPIPKRARVTPPEIKAETPPPAPKQTTPRTPLEQLRSTTEVPIHPALQKKEPEISRRTWLTTAGASLLGLGALAYGAWNYRTGSNPETPIERDLKGITKEAATLYSKIKARIGNEMMPVLQLPALGERIILDALVDTVDPKAGFGKKLTSFVEHCKGEPIAGNILTELGKMMGDKIQKKGLGSQEEITAAIQKILDVKLKGSSLSFNVKVFEKIFERESEKLEELTLKIKQPGRGR